MGRYLLKFSKENNLKYISHLDLLRVFQRAFKRAHIRLRYSQGFNPHAKIGFGQPLSLGSESTGEYMEFETVEDRAGGEYLTALSGCMPDGIRLLLCWQGLSAVCQLPVQRFQCQFGVLQSGEGFLSRCIFFCPLLYQILKDLQLLVFLAVLVFPNGLHPPLVRLIGSILLNLQCFLKAVDLPVAIADGGENLFFHFRRCLMPGIQDESLVYSAVPLLGPGCFAQGHNLR